MDNYVVLYRPYGSCPFDAPMGFQCYAEDADHSEEQCINAYPDATIVWVWVGQEGVGLDPALEEYYKTTLQGSDI